MSSLSFERQTEYSFLRGSIQDGSAVQEVLRPPYGSPDEPGRQLTETDPEAAEMLAGLWGLPTNEVEGALTLVPPGTLLVLIGMALVTTEQIQLAGRARSVTLTKHGGEAIEWCAAHIQPSTLRQDDFDRQIVALEANVPD